MTTDQPEHEQQATPRTDSVTQTQETSTQKLLVCTNEYSHILHRAPELTFFVKNYIHQYQAELLSIDPTVRGATVQLRKVLADLVHESLDAVLADVLVAVRAQKPKMIVDNPYAERADPMLEGVLVSNYPYANDPRYENLAKEGKAEFHQRELGLKVREELKWLVDVAKDAVDDELLSIEGR